MRELIEKRIDELKKYKEEAINGYVEHLGNAEMQTQSAVLNMAYGVEIDFLNDLLKII